MPVIGKEKIKSYLIEQDKKLLPVISSIPYPVAKRNTDIYSSLLYSIVSQQLSIQAANTIHTRLLSLFPDNNPSPEILKSLSLVNIRSVGVSKQKASYLKAIAEVAVDDGFNYAVLSKKKDEELINYLTQIHGIGQWTAEMQLMFTFNRKNIFPVADVGIQNVMRHLYKIDKEGNDFKAKLINIADKWKPYRTIVCKYLWKWKDAGKA